MNKRIRELAKQFGRIQYESDGKMEEVEKFAELIVKETIDEMITQMYRCYGMDESNNPQFYKMIDRTIQEMLDVAPAKD